MTIIKIEDKNQSDKDFSGLDFTNTSFNSIDFHESVFNGGHFKETHFIDCNLQHTEFTEAKFTKCSFVNCNLNYSDFIYAQVSNISFINCSFSHVEWRDNTFQKISFKECTFYNSTISLCTFRNTLFDESSSSNFCGASKRYNVFGNTIFDLPDNKIEFLKSNYGIRSAKSNVQFCLDKKNDNDFLLKISVNEYFSQVSSEQFIQLVLNTIESLLARKAKNQLQQIKYLSLICKFKTEEGDLTVIAQQLLISSLNDLCRRIKDPVVFMEIVNLIMFIKTTLYKYVDSISNDLAELEGQHSVRTIIELKLERTYSKKEIIGYFNALEFFLGHSRNTYKIESYKSGSTIVEVVFNVGIKLSLLLAFISFSLSKVSKSLSYLVEIKKNSKKLFGDKRRKKNRVRQSELMPLSIMANESNKYFVEINNIVNTFGKDAIKVEGPGKVNIIIDNSKPKNI